MDHNQWEDQRTDKTLADVLRHLMRNPTYECFVYERDGRLRFVLDSTMDISEPQAEAIRRVLTPVSDSKP